MISTSKTNINLFLKKQIKRMQTLDSENHFLYNVLGM